MNQFERPVQHPQRDEPQQAQLQHIEIPLAGVPLGVAESDEGVKLLVVGPVALTFLLPLTDEGAKQIADNLGASGVVRADLGDLARLGAT